MVAYSELKNNGKSLNFQGSSNCKALTGKVFNVLDRWSLTGGGRLRELVAHRVSTVSKFCPL